MALTERDLLKVQAANPTWHVELRNGKLVVMSPCGGMSDWTATNLAGELRAFVRDRKLGFVFGSSAGFRLPNGDIVEPDVSFVSKTRLAAVPRPFISAVPDLVVEVKSPSDSVRELEEKLTMLRGQGVQATMLIDPDKQTVWLDVTGAPRRILTKEDIIELPVLLPGWSLRVSELWSEFPERS